MSRGGVLGLQAALRYMNHCGRAALFEYETHLTRHLINQLGDIPEVAMIGSSPDDHLGVVSLSVAGMHPHDVAELCSTRGVCIRAGQHCAHPLLASLGLPAVSRASLSIYNNGDDITQLGNALRAAIRLFR